MIEKEVKIVVEYPSLDELRESLEKELKLLDIEKQEDIYFNYVYRNFKITDEAVRIRVNNKRIELTYKGPKLHSSLKAREEISIVVNDLNKTIELLRRIGFYPVITIKKTRINYLDKSFIISLDLVENLGQFIEIEAISEISDQEIHNYTSSFIRKYKIKGKLTTKSYLELLIDKYEANPKSNSNTY
ncbi:class IV adenylate cyclase [Saccharolobus islandicus]|uniref:Adenylyl cyclase CyaB n=2 Tax=Saccharolobus islandicus TaxID=43080 RepID=C4KIT3_SACI6|nr:class IV adenylate cyclase [Sulfolobus islandicus]ACP38631.1 adenylyl cyclase CyaB [Sulfolobus islandicus M.14.25]ACR42497.1 adenylyl cyclase CyaB [Sulfolobus islandicus M.16.4]